MFKRKTNYNKFVLSVYNPADKTSSKWLEI